MFGSATYTSQATLSGYKVIITHMKTPTSFHRREKESEKRYESIHPIPTTGKQMLVRCFLN